MLIGHDQVADFAVDRVNLAAEDAKEHRAQVTRLRERLASHVAANDGFPLRRMYHAGSVAKGTALANVHDLDVAVYIRASDAPSNRGHLVPWLKDRLVESNPNLKSEQFVAQQNCVTVSFSGSRLDVDVVPVLDEGAEGGFGWLVKKWSGDRLLTSIPAHLEFIGKRKKANGADFAQCIRLTKWWVRQEQARNPGFKFKSFMIELLWAHLADSGLTLTDYPAAMEQFYLYVLRTGLRELVAFDDHYGRSQVVVDRSKPIHVFDPVNPENNVARRYGEGERQRIFDASQRAFDALSQARFAPTKGDAVACWKTILGPGFKG